jgi:hypothetical protein
MLELGSAPPRAATWISRAKRVKILPRAASFAPFLRLMVDHLECPDILVFPPFATKAGLLESIMTQVCYACQPFTASLWAFFDAI